MDVSIIITAFNYGKYIKDCIESCINQIESPISYEIIIINDGSTDDTGSILESYNRDALFTISTNNIGIELASNIGFIKARGKYIVRVDADDILQKNYLLEMSKVIPFNYDFYYPNYYLIDRAGHTIDSINLPKFDSREIYCRGDFLATGTLYNAKWLKFLEGYNSEIKNSGLENYELVLKILLRGGVGFRVPEFLFRYRRHGGNISEGNQIRILENGKNLFRKLKLGEYKLNEHHPYL